MPLYRALSPCIYLPRRNAHPPIHQRLLPPTSAPSNSIPFFPRCERKRIGCCCVCLSVGASGRSLEKSLILVVLDEFAGEDRRGEASAVNFILFWTLSHSSLSHRLLFSPSIIPFDRGSDGAGVLNASTSVLMSNELFSFTMSYIYACVRYSVYISYKGLYAHSAMV